MGFRQFNLRWLGVLVILSAFVLSYMIVSFIQALSDMSQSSCTCGDSCSMVRYETPRVFYVGMFIVLLLFLAGAYLVLKKDAGQSTFDRKKMWSSKLDSLDGDEKSTYQLLIDSGGALFQSDIAGKTGLSKVRVTRILDGLEARRLLERRRRGLTNIVVLRD